MKELQTEEKLELAPLREKFESNISIIEKTVWQDEKYFILEVHVNCRTIVYIVNERNQISLMKI